MLEPEIRPDRAEPAAEQPASSERIAGAPEAEVDPYIEALVEAIFGLSARPADPFPSTLRVAAVNGGTEPLSRSQIAELATRLSPEFDGKVVSVDVNSGSYAIGLKISEAAGQILTHIPDAEIYSIKIGQNATARIRPRVTDRN